MPKMEKSKSQKTKEIFEQCIAPRDLLLRFDEHGRPMLPYALVHPDDHTLTWHCDVDNEGKLGWVFRKTLENGKPDYRHDSNVTMEEALNQRSLLLRGSPGFPPWGYYVPPRNEITISDHGQKKSVNRKQMRTIVDAFRKEMQKGSISYGENPDERARKFYHDQIPILNDPEEYLPPKESQ